MIGVHPTVTPDMVDKPNCEVAASVFQHLADFCYDMDIQQIKGHLPAGLPYAEIYDEAVDGLSVFKLSRQLATINGIDDFAWKDIWEPSTKRLRVLLSGIINFCRYKESQTIFITEMKEELQALDVVRLESVEKANRLDEELATAQAQHHVELPAMRAAEDEVQEARGVMDRLQRQRQGAERVLEDTREKLATVKEGVEQRQLAHAHLREQISRLQGQIAESPEGLEREIQDLKLAHRQQKARLEERSDERRARAQRDQVLARLQGNIERYAEVLASVDNDRARVEVARERSRKAREELASFRRALEARRAEEADLDQGLSQVASEMERAKQVHADRVQQMEERRQRALLQHQDLLARRTEEQRQQHELQAQRHELENEVACERRMLEADLGDLRTRQRSILADSEAYSQQLETFLLSHRHSADGAASAADNDEVFATPGRHKKQAYGCLTGIAASPSPARSMRSPADRWPFRSP